MNFSSTPNISVQPAPQSQNFKMKILCVLFSCPLFFREYLNLQVIINKTINIVSITLKSFWINHKDKSSQTSIDPLRLYLSPEFSVNFLLNMHILQWLGKVFTFMMFRLLENAFKGNLLNLDIFTLLLPPPSFHGKTFPKVFIITAQAQENYSSPSRQSLFLYNLCGIL